ncbi:MAG: DUF885 family protein [Parasphingopyxis sp.]|uniref:DUF885 family protein n=1 Tax=Parasphingopyxis sp. TaxID=1920299 RepID=UPI003FA18DFB
MRLLPLFAVLLLSVGTPIQAGNTDDALVTLYASFRDAVEPRFDGAIADYSPQAMAARHAAALRHQAALEAMDDSGWPISRRVDYLLALAEMRSVDFQHRVIRPWARDPSFYSTLDIGWGPKIAGAFAPPVLPIEDPVALARFSDSLRAVPALLDRARANLTDLRRDLVDLGIAHKRTEMRIFGQMERNLAGYHPDLVPAAAAARHATAEFVAWLESERAGASPQSGVGRARFDWYVRHVLLIPYSWEDMRRLGEREYQRSIAFLRIEEHEHRAVPMPAPVTSLAAFEALREEADAELLAFLRDRDIMTVPDYLVPPRNEGPYVMPVDRDPASSGPFDPPIRRNFFRETEDRDPRPLRAHNVPGHLLDTLNRARDDRPIRGRERLNFIDSSRIEGWAFYLEEMLLQAGFLDERPKAREIHYILQAKRAARILPELNIHANEWTLDEAIRSMSGRTPYWMEADDDTAIYDLGLYLRQPGLGINYYFGKLQIEALLVARAAQLGESFDLKAFHDEFLAAGPIPIALIAWEMTGEPGAVADMRRAPPLPDR